MTKEEKAKAYDEAIERARKWYDANTNEGYRGIFESIFPELKESEDEMIRKKLITFFQRFPYTNLYDASLNAKDVLAWLEKQGEQKPADKVEPKFKVGDWVIFAENHNSVYQVERMDNNRYYLRHYLGGTLSVYFDSDLIRLWTIQDAKDGDVLWHSDSASNGIFIFKEIRYDGKVICYCDYDSEDHFCLGEHHTCCWADAKILHPATKEQRDTLMKAMADAGYEFDFKEKVLKKIEQKSAWSEEDEELCNILMNICGGPHDEMDRRPWAKCINWLKSLKDRYIWKPSDEQIEALNDACEEHWEPDGLEPLYTLYQDLKKLREE